MSDMYDVEDELFDDELEFGDAGAEPDLDEAEGALRDAESHDWPESQLGGSAELDEGTELDEGIEDALAALDEIDAESSFAGSGDGELLFEEFGDESGFDDFGNDGGDLGAVLDVLRSNPGLKITLSF